jgi:hypothetical protein
MKILIGEPDHTVSQMIRYALEEDKNVVWQAFSAEDLIKAQEEKGFDRGHCFDEASSKPG